MSNAIRKQDRGVFNHAHVFTGYQGSVPYVKPKRGSVDNIGRHHVKLYGRCDICDKEILLAYMHIDAKTDEVKF